MSGVENPSEAAMAIWRKTRLTAAVNGMVVTHLPTKAEDAAALVIDRHLTRAPAEPVAWGAGWARFDDNTPVDTNLLAWGDNWRWREPHIAYHHSSYNGHKLCVTEDGRCGALFMIGNEGAPTHWMLLPAAPGSIPITSERAGGAK